MPESRSSSNVRTAGRFLALKVLLATDRAGQMTDDLLDRLLARAADGRERAFAIELIHGILRHQRMIDWRLDHVTDRPTARLPRLVHMVLRIGAYQILFMQTIPQSAAVDESVRLAKASTSRLRHDWSGFVNAVLRNLIRQPVPSWPDAQQHPVEALAVRYSCPDWLVERWLNRLGFDQTERLCRTLAEMPPFTLRANTLKTTRQGLLDLLHRHEIAAHPTTVSPVGIRLDHSVPVRDLPLFEQGGFYVEDEAGQLIPLLLDPQPGERILDACAAPGGKATHVAAIMQNQGEIIAVDRNPDRLRLLSENCARLGVSIVRPLVGDLGAAVTPAGRAFSRGFDRVLVDAPCSGLGVLRRHPEGKWQKQVRALAWHHEVQSRILAHAARLLRPGGVLVYSVCSTEPEETEQVVVRFCCAHGEFQRENVTPWLPHTGLPLVTLQGDLSTMSHDLAMDGFYAARLRRAGR